MKNNLLIGFHFLVATFLLFNPSPSSAIAVDTKKFESNVKSFSWVVRVDTSSGLPNNASVSAEWNAQMSVLAKFPDSSSLLIADRLIEIKGYGLHIAAPHEGDARIGTPWPAPRTSSFLGAEHVLPGWGFANNKTFGDLDKLALGSILASGAVVHPGMGHRDLYSISWVGGAFDILDDDGNKKAIVGNTFRGDFLFTGVHNIPEPGTIALLSLGLAGLGFIRRRRS